MFSFFGRPARFYVCFFAAIASSWLWGDHALAHHGATHDWNVFNGLFNSFTNWNPIGVPGAADTARFASGSGYTVTFNNSPINTALQQTAGNVTFVSTGGLRTYTITGTGTAANLSGGLLTLGTSGNPLNLAINNNMAVSGGNLQVLHGSQVTTNVLSSFGSSGTTSEIVVSGSGSTFNSSSTATNVNFGSTGGSATFTVNNGASASFGRDINVGPGPNAATSGTLNVLAGSTFAVRSLNIGTSEGTGTVTVSGSSITQATGGALTVGSTNAAHNPGKLNVDINGTFNSGEANITVNATGSIKMDGGAFNANADVNVNGGSIIRTSGTFNLASGRTLTASNNGSINLGMGATLSGGTTWLVGSGADLFSSSSMDIGTSGGVTNLTIDGAGTSLTTGAGSIWGASGHTAQVTVRNGASANVAGINLAGSSAAGTTGILAVESGATMTTQNLVVANAGGATTSGTITVTGLDSTLSQSGGSALILGHASTGAATLNVLDRGTFNTGTGPTTINATGSIHIGAGGTGGLFNANGDVSVNGGSITRTSGNFNLAAGRTLTASNNAQISFDGAYEIGQGTTFAIISGADFSTTNTLYIGGSGGSGALIVDGAGSTLSAGASGPIEAFWGLSGNSADVTIRNSATAEVSIVYLGLGTGTGTLSVESRAQMTFRGLFIAADGGDGNVTITGSDSSLAISTSLIVGHNSFGTATLNVLDGGTVTAGPVGTLLRTTGTINIDGGFANLGPLNWQGGALNFLAGSLSYGGNLTVGPGGLFGADLTLPAIKHLALTGTTTVGSFRTLTLDGGRLSTGELVVQSGGVFEFNKGTLAITGAGGLTIGAAGPLGAHLQVTFGAVIEVSNGLTNEGLITGGGVLVAALNNTSSGEVRAEAGNTLFFDGIAHSNSGELRLLGGWADFGGSLTNASTGRITGRGMLSTTAGLLNQGHIAFSSGITDVYGDVTNDTANAAVGITISGNADATFWGDVTNTSGLLRVSANSSATFFGGLAGNGISGPGDVYLEADITPGSSPGLAEFGGNVHFGPLANLEIELGGTTKGSQYDALDISGAAALDGTLDVALLSFMPSAGDVFEVITAAAGLSGTFAQIILPALAGELFWNVDYSANSLTLAVAAPGLPGDFNNDGSVNAADYVLWCKTDGTQEGYDEWRANFGTTLTGSGSAASTQAAVPEPTALRLAAVGLVACAACRSRRRSGIRRR